MLFLVGIQGWTEMTTLLAIFLMRATSKMKSFKYLNI